MCGLWAAESRVARVGPTTPTCARSLADASVDPTEARKALAIPDRWISIEDAVAEQPSDPRQSVAGADCHRTRAA
jgi:hypothetical protein